MYKSVYERRIFTSIHSNIKIVLNIVKAFCDDGKQSNNVTGTCEPCPVGFYKGPSNDRCQKCPPNKTTFTNGSVSLDECIGKNSPSFS